MDKDLALTRLLSPVNLNIRMSAESHDPHHEKAESTEAKSEAKSEDGVLKLEKLHKRFFRAVSYLFLGLKSSDRPTRRMAVVFVTSLLGILIVSGLAVGRYRQVKTIQALEKRETESRAKQIAEAYETKVDEAKKRMISLSLGDFTLELFHISDPRKLSRVLNIVEMEVVVECDTDETCMFIEGNVVKAKNQVANALNPMDREEIMSKEGKAKLKRKITHQLNTWLLRGKVLTVYFSKLVIS